MKPQGSRTESYTIGSRSDCLVDSSDPFGSDDDKPHDECGVFGYASQISNIHLLIPMQGFILRIQLPPLQG